jgi:hypothetical protein
MSPRSHRVVVTPPPPPSARWTAASLRESRATLLLLQRQLPGPALARLVTFLRVPCAGSAALLHPCGEGHASAALLRVGHRLGLRPLAPLDGLQETDVVDARPLLPRKTLYQLSEFREVWYALARPAACRGSWHTQCGHFFVGEIHAELQLQPGEPVEDQLSALLLLKEQRSFEPSIQVRPCFTCGNVVERIFCSFEAEAPEVLHLCYASDSVGEDRGFVPETLDWGHCPYLLVAAVFAAGAPLAYGTLLRVADTQLFRLRLPEGGCRELAYEAAAEELRRQLLHLFYLKTKP